MMRSCSFFLFNGCPWQRKRSSEIRQDWLQRFRISQWKSSSSFLFSPSFTFSAWQRAWVLLPSGRCGWGPHLPLWRSLIPSGRLCQSRSSVDPKRKKRTSGTTERDRFYPTLKKWVKIIKSTAKNSSLIYFDESRPQSHWPPPRLNMKYIFHCLHACETIKAERTVFYQNPLRKVQRLLISFHIDVVSSIFWHQICIGCSNIYKFRKRKKKHEEKGIWRYGETATGVNNRGKEFTSFSHVPVDPNFLNFWVIPQNCGNKVICPL